MDAVLRALAIYAFLLLIFRLAGRRTLAQLTTFDFVLLLVIGESTQQALIGDNFSVTQAMLLIMTLVGLDVGLSLLKNRSPRLETWIDGRPIVLVDDGRLLEDRMRKCRVGPEDVLAAARRLRGLSRMEQVRYAVLEETGEITIIPFDDGPREATHD